MQYKRLFKYDPQCWMPSVEGHVICGHTDFVTSFLYFDTKSWTLIAYCALMLSIVNLRIKVDVTISCLLFLHSYDLLNQYAMKSLTIAPDNPKAYCWLIRSLKAQGMNELATNELAAAKEHLTTEEYEEILAFGANW